MRRDEGNNKESDLNNKKTTRGRRIIRTTKSETLKLGDRPSTYVHNCRKTIHSVDGSCGKGTHADRREMDEATTTKWETMKKHKENPRR